MPTYGRRPLPRDDGKGWVPDATGILLLRPPLGATPARDLTSEILVVFGEGHAAVHAECLGGKLFGRILL